MSETANNQGAAAAAAGDDEKPAQENDVKFLPFPEPTEEEFEDDIGHDERSYYRNKFKDLNTVNSFRLHCSACDRHLGSSTRNDSRMRAHPLLRTLVCHICHTFYNSGEFEKGDDGSELYCRWCGQGGQVYCCSDCPHVFCAKCVKRNLGVPKIREIENTDDWKCFKCNPRCLWDLRAVCWALLRYCDLKNKITHKTENPQLKEAYQKDCAKDHTDCCRNKQRRKEKPEPKIIKKEPDSAKKGAVVASTIARIPSTIQVKKFASINPDESIKEKKVLKRPLSPYKPKPGLVKTPIPIAPSQKVLNPMSMPPLKKIRMPITPMKMHQEKKPPMQYPQANVSYARIRPKFNNMPIPIMSAPFNGFPNNSFNNYSVINSDNINLSLESLTQGLDMAAVVAMSKNNINLDDDVVCTPDFPLEPLCEVTEDNTDDDVQCITPVSANKPNTLSAPALVTRAGNFPELSTDNIIQMTDEDVTVNTITGGLKFRVDPQTLSSNKMYRLPDGRIFAINANPNMPGGYSATIVAVAEAAGKQPPIVPKGATYAAKLSAVTTSVQTSTPKSSSRSNSSGRAKPTILKRTLASSKKLDSSSSRVCDLQVPVEWYRYNLIDAVDSLEYSLSRLNKLKKEATTHFLRHLSVDEMRSLHRTLERLLNTSATRFNEIRDNLNKELRQYLVKKAGGSVSDDDDDCEILPNSHENDDPIFIDENSMESVINEINSNESQEVDLTGVGSSDHNDSGENRVDSVLNVRKEATTPTDVGDNNNKDLDEEIENENKTDNLQDVVPEKARKEKEPNVTCSGDKEVKSHDEEAKDHTQTNGATSQLDVKEQSPKSPIDDDEECTEDDKMQVDDNKPHTDDDAMHMDDNKACSDDDSKDKAKSDESKYKGEPDDFKDKAESDDTTKSSDKTQPEDNEHTDVKAQSDTEHTDNDVDKSIKGDQPSKEDESITPDNVSIQENDGKTQDSEMSEELIEKLLKDDNVDELDNILNNKAMDVVESV